MLALTLAHANTYWCLTLCLCFIVSLRVWVVVCARSWRCEHHAEVKSVSSDSQTLFFSSTLSSVRRPHPRIPLLRLIGATPHLMPSFFHLSLSLSLARCLSQLQAHWSLPSTIISFSGCLRVSLRLSRAPSSFNPRRMIGIQETGGTCQREWGREIKSEGTRKIQPGDRTKSWETGGSPVFSFFLGCLFLSD